MFIETFVINIFFLIKDFKSIKLFNSVIGIETWLKMIFGSLVDK